MVILEIIKTLLFIFSIPIILMGTVVVFCSDEVVAKFIGVLIVLAGYYFGWVM